MAMARLNLALQVSLGRKSPVEVGSPRVLFVSALKTQKIAELLSYTVKDTVYTNRVTNCVGIHRVPWYITRSVAWLDETVCEAVWSSRSFCSFVQIHGKLHGLNKPCTKPCKSSEISQNAYPHAMLTRFPFLCHEVLDHDLRSENVQDKCL